MPHYRQTALHINLEQIAANYSCLAAMSRNEFVCPMLKANAYGHGAIEVGNRLEKESCPSFGVALYEEGIELRKAGIKTKILVFAPLVKGSVQAALDFDLTPVILADGDFEFLKNEMRGQNQKLSVHLKINFSMNRMGFDSDIAAQLYKKIDELSGVKLEGLCTHFPKSEDLVEKTSETESDMRQFLDFSKSYNVEFRHALNSAAILSLHKMGDERIHELGMRPGIALYGALPDLGLGLQLPIREAMTLRSTITHLQKLKKGEAVSYMGQWVAPEDSLIGVIPIGYADGMRRGLSGKVKIKLDAEVCPQIGIICMDYVMVDLTHIQNKNLLGANVEVLESTQAWADELNTIPYEVMTGMSQRLPRMYA